MKFCDYFYSIFCLLFVIFTCGALDERPSLETYDPLLVVVLMVKDEAAVMRATLEPMVKAGIIAYFIFDTGSTDETIAVTEAFFKEKGIKNYVIMQEPFIDFSTSRNRALELAEEKFSHAGFFLMPDAEWYLVNGKDLLKFCEKEKNSKEPNSYMIRVLHPTMDFYAQRLLRPRRGCRFDGVVHETITVPTFSKVPGEVYFDLRVSKKGAQKTAKRWLRDKELLLHEYEIFPESPRTCFYLAQTFECLNDLEQAALYYEKRTELAGWDEENYMTWYRLAGVYEQLNRWDDALRCYLRAYTMRPQRIEPLVRIARHYLIEGNHALAYLFSQRANQAPYPENDILFVEKDVYEYTRYDLLGQSAWYIGEYETGEEAIRNAIKAQPNLPHLFRNLAFYLSKKQELQIAEAAMAA